MELTPFWILLWSSLLTEIVPFVFQLYPSESLPKAGLISLLVLRKHWIDLAEQNNNADFLTHAMPWNVFHSTFAWDGTEIILQTQWNQSYTSKNCVGVSFPTSIFQLPLQPTAPWRDIQHWLQQTMCNETVWSHATVHPILENSFRKAFGEEGEGEKEKVSFPKFCQH